MSEQNEFIDNIKSWVTLDNKLKLLNEKCKEIREERNDYSDKINEYVEKKNLFDNIVEITGGKIKFTKNKSQSTITYKFLEKCLGDMFSANEVDRIMTHIKDSREYKMEPEIKRYFINN